MKKYPPLSLLAIISAKYPDAWTHIEDIRKGKGVGLPDWPDMVYVPTAAGLAVAAEGSGLAPGDTLSVDIISDANAITALAPWRVSKEVFVFDEDLENMLYSQLEDSDIPSEILLSIPYHCFYMELNNFYIGNKKASGMFAHLEYDTKESHMELRVLAIDSKGKILLCYPYHLNVKSLKDNFEMISEESIRAINHGRALSDKGAENAPSLEDTKVALMQALQLILYICSVNGDIIENAVQKTIYTPSTTVKDQYREVRKWDTGVRVGSSIRKAKITAIEDVDDTSDEVEFAAKHIKRSSKRPHTRRGHWHHFWTGPRKEPAKRKLVLKWVAPAFIGKIDVSDSPVVLHKIKEEKDGI